MILRSHIRNIILMPDLYQVKLIKLFQIVIVNVILYNLIQPPDGKFNNKVINVYILLKHQRLHVPKDKNDKLKNL